ncbi:hypothetical protein ACO0LB_13860 [Undibacterium sp. SXout7W]|uniref:hypothetical protein n=1 Tax=Undibacterium sp. SXout7W TaxID=3413049 RepID=UPI003BF02505
MKILPFLAALLCASSAFAATPAAVTNNAPDLDLNIHYYSKVLTPEGVTREASYDETMLRRPGHVWTARTLPKNAQDAHDDHGKDKKKNNTTAKESKHKHFNHVVIPRHIAMENNQLRIEFINAADKEVIAIPPSEYENVNFDGSWDNAYFLVDPQIIKVMTVSAKSSPVPGARWREREKNGVFQRVLWDEQKQIPLIIESGNKEATFYRRVDIKPQTTTVRDLPWANTKGFARKEYADFLD